MPYKLVKIGSFDERPVFSALASLGYSSKIAQRLCDKGRVRDSAGVVLAKNSIINGELFMIDYVCDPKGLKPIFEHDDFAVFDDSLGGLNRPNRDFVSKINILGKRHLFDGTVPNAADTHRR